VFAAGAWLFVIPTEGQRAFARDTALQMRFENGHWTAPINATDPAGGSVIDSEARAVLSQVLTALEDAGLIART
jgi:hypothetical protein